MGCTQGKPQNSQKTNQKYIVSLPKSEKPSRDSQVNFFEIINNYDPKKEGKHIQQQIQRKNLSSCTTIQSLNQLEIAENKIQDENNNDNNDCNNKEEQHEFTFCE